MAATGFGSSGALVLAGALLILFSPMPDTLAKKTLPGMSPTNDLSEVSNKTGICRTKDIRNTMNSLNDLKGCRVVEGFVQILLFDNVNESAFDDISFPELTEITDFLLLFRVNGLRSIGQLFPNLAVIRGQEKVFGYSFVVYEMSSLQEIGLHSLTNITSGLIRIDKNPSLCYVNSIDWERIAHEKGQHFIKNIKADNECPLCPGDDDSSSDAPCPVSTNKLHNGMHLCWNAQKCQKICPENCTACDSKGQCCDDKCLGGCSDDDPKACHVCRDFSMDGKCMDSCPQGRYEFLGRRCITREECINAVKPMQLYPKIQHEHPYKIFKNKSCVLGCPSLYTDDYVKHTCEPCDGNVVNELEENLNMIEEIDGYLKIVRSFPLVSLTFFKRLRLIRGNTLESQKYVFIVLDNQNLQDIWNWDNRTLEITNGRLFFHFNPRLCMNKIEMLREKANLEPFTNLEVAPNSNGDKIACNVHDLVVNITKKHSKSIVLAWPQFEMKDHRKLLGYVVYSIATPFKNITLYDGRDACGGDGWRVDDVPIVDENNTIYFLLSKLNPYTQYAFYVKTYTIASELSGAQSQIYYFRTLPDQPTLPVEVNIATSDSETFHITWKKPAYPNGNVTYYIVRGMYREEEIEQLRMRTYCSSSTHYKENTPKVETTKLSTKLNNTCECKDDPKTKEPKHKNATDVTDQIHFEDKLYNFVYIKKLKVDTNRRKRNLIEFPQASIENKEETTNKSDERNITDPQNKFITFYYKVYGKNELTVRNLRHYTAYEIKIQACREAEGKNDKTYCSAAALKTVRTEKNNSADLIIDIDTNRSASGDFVVAIWKKPDHPNGHILAYELAYQHLDRPHAIPTKICIPAFDAMKSNNTYSYTIDQLSPGKYSLRILARSQAGSGVWSEYKYFYIEEPSSKWTVVIIIVIIIILMGVGIATFYFYKTKCGIPNDIKLIASVNPEYVVYEPDDWEVLRDKIKLIKELGQGSFGMVYEGNARDIKGKASTKCAIKTVNEHATNRERIEFLNEASVMKAFDTAHVVRLLGVVSQGQPTLVVMELMANGDLKSYLRSHRPDVDCYDKGSKQPPTLRRILQMAIEISDGMAYLSAKKFVHRDLAARNCMVAEDLTVKIGDFGMTRDIYETDYYRKGTKGLLPVRWMAPESLKDGVFTSSSDVWSYGVVLWEMATLASQPYQGLSNDQVLRYVIDGGIMERPENCPDKLYDLMICCWRHKPTDRPSFLNMCSLLLEDASNTFCQISFYHSAAGMEARNSRPSQSPLQDDPSTPLRRNQIDENYSLTSSDAESEHELEAESNIDFISYPSMTKEVSSTANGYVSTRVSNGTTT